MFLTWLKIIERVTRQVVMALELGGAKVHARNGVSHMDAVDDVAAVTSCATSSPTCPAGPAACCRWRRRAKPPW